MTSPNHEKISNNLWTLPQEGNVHLYAVLDGARNPGIYTAVLKSECEFECLYRGELEPDLAEAAPYLVKLDKQKAFTSWLIEKGWGDSWGIFLQTSASFRDLRKHLRKFLMVYDSNAKPMYFRYYDPRVLRIYLPTCNPDELATIFGPIKCFMLEDKNPETLLYFINANGVLKTETLSIGKHEHANH